MAEGGGGEGSWGTGVVVAVPFAEEVGFGFSSDFSVDVGIVGSVSTGVCGVLGVVWSLLDMMAGSE